MSENGEDASGNKSIEKGSNNEDREKEKEKTTAKADIVESISHDSSLSLTGNEEETRKNTALRQVQETKEKNLQKMVTEWKEQWERTWRTAVREEAKEVLKKVREKLHEKERQNEGLGEDFVKYQAQMYVEQANWQPKYSKQEWTIEKLQLENQMLKQVAERLRARPMNEEREEGEGDKEDKGKKKHTDMNASKRGCNNLENKRKDTAYQWDPRGIRDPEITELRAGEVQTSSN